MPVAAAVDPKLEMTALCDRALRAGGPALLFENPSGDFVAPAGGTIPVLGNLFGTPQRVAKAMGADPRNWQANLRDIGRLLGFLMENYCEGTGGCDPAPTLVRLQRRPSGRKKGRAGR